MTEHRLERIDFQRPSRFVAVCSCSWRSEPTLNAGLAGALWDRHVEPPPPVEIDAARIVEPGQRASEQLPRPDSLTRRRS